MQSIRRVDVYRVAERPDAPLPLTEEQFGARATLIGSVPYEEIKQAHETLNYTDTLTLTEPVRLRYAIRYVNSAGQRAAFSNFLLIEPAARVSQPPVLTSVNNPTESSVVIHWQTPPANVDGSTPVNLLDYRGQHYLVAPRGVTQWVRNVRAGSEVELRLGSRRERVKLVEIADADPLKIELIRQYLRKWAFEVGVFFEGVSATSPEEDLRRVAPSHPTFRIEPA